MKRLLPVLGIPFFLAACVAGPTALEPGVYTADNATSVTLSEAWSKYPANMNVATKGEVLTKDGPPLNRLHFIQMSEGEALLKTPKKVPEDTPVFTVGMSEIDIVDMVTNSLLKISYSVMEAENIRPVTIDGQEGLRFDLTGKWENGLNVSGDVVAVPKGEKLNLVMFIAPTMHYYPTSETEVEAIIASIDLP